MKPPPGWSPLRAGIGRLPWEVLLPATIVLVAVPTDLASSSLGSIVGGARPWRWAALALFAAAASAAAVARGRGVRLPAAPAVAGLLFIGLAAVSASWSIDPSLTVERAVSLAVLLGGVWAVGRACAGRRSAAEGAAGALAAAAAGLAVAGFAVTAYSRQTGFYLATSPSRFRGLGENPDTAPLVEAVALPLLLFLAWRHTGWRRLLAVAGAAAVALGILLSESRASLLAAALAALTVVGWSRASASRRMLGAALVVAVAIGGLFAANAIVRRVAPAPSAAPAARSAATTTREPRRRLHRRRVRREAPAHAVSRAPLFPRSNSLLNGSGRTVAWKAAFHLANGRPLAGFGFGTEATAFGPVARSLAPVFESSYVENSYLGTYVQLGIAGVVLCAALLGAIVGVGVRAVRRAGGSRPLAVALLAATLAGLVEAVFQSYIWSVGDVASLTLWICAALLVGVTAHEEPEARRR